MKEWGASAVEKAEEISRVAVAKGEEFTKISKIKIEILQHQKEKSKKYEKLGKLVYHLAQDDNMANFTANSEFFEIISEINNIGQDIKNKENAIIEIKKAYGIEDNDIDNRTYYQRENGLSEEE
jgi:hypothetical protein